jgi:hypothetical protein
MKSYFLSCEVSMFWSRDEEAFLLEWWADLGEWNVYRAPQQPLYVSSLA